jgi:hypothetical protein
MRQIRFYIIVEKCVYDCQPSQPQVTLEKIPAMAGIRIGERLALFNIEIRSEITYNSAEFFRMLLWQFIPIQQILKFQYHN